jgi:hypothetical protein
MKVELSNWEHNSKPRQFEWKTDDETWSKICSLQETDFITSLSEAQKREAEELMVPLESIKMWTGWALDKEVQIKITKGFPCDCSEYLENLTLEGEASFVQELVRKLIPSKEEMEEWCREKWQRRKEIEEYVNATFDFKPIDDGSGVGLVFQIVRKTQNNDEPT